VDQKRQAGAKEIEIMPLFDMELALATEEFLA